MREHSYGIDALACARVRSWTDPLLRNREMAVKQDRDWRIRRVVSGLKGPMREATILKLCLEPSKINTSIGTMLNKPWKARARKVRAKRLIARDCHFTMRLTYREGLLLKKRADESDCSMSEYVRACIRNFLS